MLTHWSQLVPNNYVNRHPRTLSNTTATCKKKNPNVARTTCYRLGRNFTVSEEGISWLKDFDGPVPARLFMLYRLFVDCLGLPRPAKVSNHSSLTSRLNYLTAHWVGHTYILGSVHTLGILLQHQHISATFCGKNVTVMQSFAGYM